MFLTQVKQAFELILAKKYYLSILIFKLKKKIRMSLKKTAIWIRFFD